MIGRARLFVATAMVLSALASARAQPPGIGLLLRELAPFTDSELARLHGGEAVGRHVPGSVGHEIVVVAAVRIAAPVDAMARVLRDIERFESGRGFLATRKLSAPPRLDDFGTLQLPADDVGDLHACRPGKCAVKLDRPAIDRLASIDWRSGDAASRAQAVVREMALARIDEYRQGGNARLPDYVDKPVPTPVAQELAELVRGARTLLAHAPGLIDYLVGDPASAQAQSDDFFYWSLAEFGLKPVLRINHVVIAPTGRPAGVQVVATTKQLYASHYFNTALEVRALVDDPERRGTGHYLVSMTLARADGFTGLFGRLIRAKVRSASLEGVVRTLRATKHRVEEARPLGGVR